MTHNYTENTFYKITLLLTIIGGINWGLIGVFRFNLVAALLGVDTLVSKIVYSLVGISALYVAFAYLQNLNNSSKLTR